jgi:cytochrome c peroxidase
MSYVNKKKRMPAVAGIAAIGLCTFFVARAQVAPDPLPKLVTLRGVPVPQPRDLMQFVKDRQAAIVLGKALFWDAAVGSDGKTACATCHFHAGADNRAKNQLNPDLNNQHGAPLATAFNKSASGGLGGPNYTLNARDFPTHQLVDPLDRNSVVLYDSDDVISSQGVFDRSFRSSNPRAKRRDDCVLLPDPVFQVQGHNTRRVEPRNTPTVVNAVFNFRNFWDGRANNVFNGSSPFGNRDPDAGVWVNDPSAGLAKTRVALENSSLASQASGPPGSAFEMSCGGRMFADIGHRLLVARPLAQQPVAATDSVLAAYRAAFWPGLRDTYAGYVRAAFLDRYWNSAVLIDLGTPLSGPKLYTQMEANFSLFFALAVQMYESTLVSDDAPLDRYLNGDSSALTDVELRGMNLFTGKAGCINCHKGPQLTGAGTPLFPESQEEGLVERMIMGDGKIALYDSGFYNIGVRPTVEDIGLGGKDPFGNPLSFARQYKKAGFPAAGVEVQPDKFKVDPCKFAIKTNETDCAQPPPADSRIAVDGAFKVPGLRNVELTGPYFHNGSRSTIEQVVAFYNRGGDRRGQDGDDTTGFNNADAGENNLSNHDADIKVLGLTDQERADLAAFLKRPLTDERVRWERAPFDHPHLAIPDGHPGDESTVEYTPNSMRAKDSIRVVPAVGAAGRKLGPLKPFAGSLAP